MAWNEPGGNSNNQDPWGGRKGGGRQGPPDLDEAFRKLQESLKAAKAVAGRARRISTKRSASCKKA